MPNPAPAVIGLAAVYELLALFQSMELGWIDQIFRGQPLVVVLLGVAVFAQWRRNEKLEDRNEKQQARLEGMLEAMTEAALALKETGTSMRDAVSAIRQHIEEEDDRPRRR